MSSHYPRLLLAIVVIATLAFGGVLPALLVLVVAGMGATGARRGVSPSARLRRVGRSLGGALGVWFVLAVLVVGSAYLSDQSGADHSLDAAGMIMAMLLPVFVAIGLLHGAAARVPPDDRSR
jgi:cytochrome bd-type quinol oxidase subunit 2